MGILLTRVVNEQQVVGSAPYGANPSLLLDKIDKSQGNSENPPYAQIEKQQIYVPYWNPLDTTVKGYSDFVQSDEVLLAMEADGVIGRLETDGYVSVTVFDSDLIATPTVTSAANAAGTTTIGGTTFLSLTPDVTYATFVEPGGASQTIPQTAFTGHTAIQIQIPDAAVTIGGGVPGVGWTVTIQSNSKQSNTFTL
jgi:hypothetical protein